MTRRLLNLLTALSLLVGFAVTAVWVRSYLKHDVLQVTRGWRQVVVHSEGGACVVLDTATREKLEHGVYWWAEPASSRMSLARFSLRRSVPSWPEIAWTLQFPHWAAIAATGIWPAVRLLGWRRRCRCTAADVCPRCGYDLRATPGRCPECGTTASVSTAG